MANMNFAHSQDFTEEQFAALNLAETLSLIDDSAAAGFFTADEADAGKSKISAWYDALADAKQQIDMLIKVNEEIYTVVTLKRLQAVRAQ